MPKKFYRINQISCKFIAVTLILAILVPMFGTTLVSAEVTPSQDITVEIAHNMIEHNKKHSNLLILDVRTECEYSKGHLYNAILLPLDELELRLNELVDYNNVNIILYCKAGERSQQATQILLQNGYTHLFNMLGGIIAWLEADYPIYTSYHYVSVDKINNKPIVQIDPLISSRYTCGCSNPSNQTNLEIPDSNYTIIANEENYKETQITTIYNNTIYQSLWKKSLLYDFEEELYNANKTIQFSKTEVITNESSNTFYSLIYLYQYTSYNLTILTTLIPMDDQNYNSSSTTVIYEPENKSDISMEIVKFNMSVTLSENFKILGKVSREIGKVFKKSHDETLRQFGEGYYIMNKELNFLSKFVESKLQGYNHRIANCQALILDYLDDGGDGGGTPITHPVPGISCYLCIIAIEAGTLAGCAAILYFFPAAFVWCIEAAEMMTNFFVAHTLCESWGYC